MQNSTALFARMLAVAALVLTPSGGALACACCSEPGQRLEMVVPLDSYLKGELDRIAIAPSARLYTDVGFPDSIEGVEAPSDGEYSVVLRRTERTVLLTLADAEGLPAHAAAARRRLA